MIEWYGTSCFLQLLDKEPAPTECKSQDLKKRKTGLSSCQKMKFQDKLSAKLQNLNLHHYYTSFVDDLGNTNNVQTKPKELVGVL